MGCDLTGSTRIEHNHVFAHYGVSGKKAILVFTDGADNSSLLSMEAAIGTIKRVGIPVYCVAQGEALQSSALLKRLEEISVSTGAASFKAQRSNEVAKIFDEIGKDLQNVYLLGYYPLRKHQIRLAQNKCGSPATS